MDTSNLENKNPEFLTNIFQNAVFILANYGWYILICLLVIIYIYIKLYPSIEKYLQDRAENEYSAKYHKNADLYVSRQNEMENARLKMQEDMNKASEQYKLKMKQKELQRQQELLKQYDDISCGQRLGKKTKSLKKEYNPLIGNSSESKYQPPKRSPCNGGGCGRK